MSLGILTGEIKWINGPFAAGEWTDLTIFCHALMQHLDLGERVEADDGYDAESLYVTKVPGDLLTQTREEDALQKRVHEAM